MGNKQTQPSTAPPDRGGFERSARRALLALAAGAALLAGAPGVAAQCVPGVACAYQNDADLPPDSGWIAYRVGGASWTLGDATSVGASAGAAGTTASAGARYEDAGFDGDPEHAFAAAKLDTAAFGHVAGLFDTFSMTDSGGGLEPAEQASLSSLVYFDGTTASVGLEYYDSPGDLSPGTVSPKY